ncbi:MAG: hypothetical protein KDC05_10770 [Bacteroidales bacterium]|nr:hypothetical protein [Bacteroidales bacterium]
MINKFNMQEDSESTNFIVFLYRWRKPILIITGIAIAASILFSSTWFITPKYKSTVIMYPVSSSSISKALLSVNPSAEQDILQFGEEEQTEQMLQILNSNRIRDKVIDKYNLMEHYDINPGSEYKNTYLFKAYEKNISFRRTEYMAVKITVLDKDPVIAANIANDISELLDSTKSAMQKNRAKKALQIVEEEYLDLKNEVQAMEDSLTELRSYGVIDYESQAEMINQQLAIELARGNKAGVKALEDKLAILAKYGGAYVSIRDALEFEKKKLSEVKAKYEEAKIDANEVLPQKFVVNSAYPAEKKSYPIRWIIVAVTTLSTLILTVLVLIILESLSGYSKKKKTIRST